MLPGRSQYATVQEVADHFNVSTRTVYRLIEDGTLDAVPIPRGKRTTYRVKRASVEELERNSAVS